LWLPPKAHNNVNVLIKVTGMHVEAGSICIASPFPVHFRGEM
jgi:hypothetical protein